MFARRWREEKPGRVARIGLSLLFAVSGLSCAQSAVSDSADGEDARSEGVRLQVGDDFQQANDRHPAGTVFRIASGVHVGQRVVNPQKGNQWIGAEGAILDGEGALSDAFSGRAEQVVLQNLELRNYADNGVYFKGGSGVIVDRLTVRDTGSGDGESNGAVRLLQISDISVTRCHFTRVSSGVLPTQCTGPIRIEWNTGINTGRNFVQLAECAGGGIAVRYNSMERQGDYLRPGAEDVEDWISVYKVRGLPDDPARVNYNRARGHGPSRSGSFIMLGDGGGQYQEAVGNVGVTPGQVGIGLSGGEHIEARDNRMFSAVWAQSNVAFYSSNYAAAHPCAHHAFEGNRANWSNRDGRQNPYWTNRSCPPVTAADNVFPDAAIDDGIWSEWEGIVAKEPGAGP